MIKIEDLIPQILQPLKKGSQVRPTVYAECEGPCDQDIYPMFHFIGDARTKASILFNEGRSAGRTNRDCELVEIIFVTEAWLTEGARNPNPGQRPPASMKQKECVMFHRVSGIPPFTQTASYYEIKRFTRGPKKGKVEELAVFMVDQPVAGLLVQAFVAGWRSRGMTDEEVRVQQPQGISSFLR